jgi:hypothetical protein
LVVPGSNIGREILGSFAIYYEEPTDEPPGWDGRALF